MTETLADDDIIEDDNEGDGEIIPEMYLVPTEDEEEGVVSSVVPKKMPALVSVSLTRLKITRLSWVSANSCFHYSAASAVQYACVSVYCLTWY